MMEARGSSMSQWCLQEFASVDLGDQRLNQRFLQTAVQLASYPQASISQACQNRAAIKGAYRLFAHDKCDRDEILEAHVAHTIERIGERKQIFVIQDTTYFEFGSHQKTRGLGPIAAKHLEHHQGLLSHAALVVGMDGVSLGLLDQRIWARGNPEYEGVLEGTKESSKWLTLLKETQKRIPPEARSITLADREADITDLLEFGVEADLGFVIRARDRALKGSEHQWLRRHLEQEPKAAEYSVRVPIKPSRWASRATGWRKAQVGVHFGRVAIRKKTGELPLYAVLAQERDFTPDSEGVSWILLTNIAIHSAQDALERIEWYQQRWHIENFHRVLKSGCTVEETRLQEAPRLDRYITLMSVIAWKLYWLTHLSRAEPDRPCEEILSSEEWKLLHFQMHPGKPIPKTPPSVRDATHWIGRLGGFVGNKKHPDPGVITLWRGYQRLNDIVLGFKLYQHAAICGEL